MCSIFALLNLRSDPAAARELALTQSKLLRHRGPDWSGIYADDSAVLAHERLSIVGVDSGAQPLESPDQHQWLAVNGEIYNHLDLRHELILPYAFLTHSDCEVILPLWRENGPDFLNLLNGIFAFVLYDRAEQKWLIARDPIGVVPLYWGRDEHGNILVASEVKALVDVCLSYEEFPPGHYWMGGPGAENGDGEQSSEPVRYYQPEWRDFDVVEGAPAHAKDIQRGLEEAIERQLMCDVPYGVLLSGGLDSSIVAAVASKFSRMRVEEGGVAEAWFPRLHSFAIGLEGAPDLKAARKVADHLQTVHHEFHFTFQQGLDSLKDVIYHLETYDVTTIRASTPMYLMARRIKAMGIKMVLSGEGADEIFGGYLYFHKAPNAREFHEETVRKLDQLHWYDCLRANKSMAAWGLEARVPFLDREFLDIAMAIDPAAKMCGGEVMEKAILREAFHGRLPDEILWRQKEQFSDGVGYTWIDSLREHADANVSDEQMENAAWRFPINPPASKEAYFYRTIFDELFPGETAAKLVPGGPSVACSTPTAIAWDESFAANADPSGRAVKGVHEKGYE